MADQLQNLVLNGSQQRLGNDAGFGWQFKVAEFMCGTGVLLMVSGAELEKLDEQIQQSERQHFEVIEADHSADLQFAGHSMIHVESTKSGYLNLRHAAPSIPNNGTGLLRLTNFGKGSASDIRLTFLSARSDRHEVKALGDLHLLPEQSTTIYACPGQGFKLSSGKSYVSALVEFKDHRNERRLSITHFEADLDLKHGRLVLTVISNESPSPHDRTESLGGYASGGLRI